MSLNSVNNNKEINNKISYTLEPPDGGWGYMIVASIVIMNMVTIVPIISFGLIYGNFLATLGKEASATSIINSIFIATVNFMGLVTNQLMKSYSTRFLGILGSIIFFIGNFSTIFVSSVGIMIFTKGVLEGVGFGLMLPSVVTTFNKYFIKRKSMMLILAMTLTGIGTSIFPYIVLNLFDSFGYRGTLLILSALTLNGFLSMLTLQPVERHMKKVFIQTNEMPFLSKIEDENNEENDNDQLVASSKTKSYLNKFWLGILDFIEFSLLKDPLYMNISVGLALVCLAEILFLSMLPMFLKHMNYNDEDTTLMMTIFMGSDLAGRISLSIFTAFIKISSRKIFLVGTCMITILRIGFIISSGSWIPTLLIMSLLGFLRCSTQVVFLLVLAEFSQTRFPASFALYQAIRGSLSFISGQISSLIALNTTKDLWVQLFLTFQAFVCVICWCIEMFCRKTKI